MYVHQHRDSGGRWRPAGLPRQGGREPERERDGALERRYLSFVYQPLTENGGTTGILVHGVDVAGQVEARREAAGGRPPLDRVFRGSPEAG